MEVGDIIEEQARLNGFDVQVVGEGQVAKFLISGELDMATTPLLEEHLAAVEAHGSSTIVIDLAPLTFMDSSGLYALLRAARRSEERGTRLVLANCPDAVRGIFELTGTAGLLAGAPSPR